MYKKIAGIATLAAILIGASPNIGYMWDLDEAKQTLEEAPNSQKISYEIIDGKTYLSIEDLDGVLDDFKYDKIDGNYLLIKYNNIQIEIDLLNNIAKREGWYIPLLSPIIVNGDDVRFDMGDISSVLNVSYEERDDDLYLKPLRMDRITDYICEKDDLEAMKKKIQYISSPIKGLDITDYSGQLPGSLREYRNGVHEGIDWYTRDVVVDNTTDVFSMTEGEIVRIDHDYKEMSPEEREDLLSDAKNYQITPRRTLDLMRGRQVWVQTDNQVLIRYAHLSSVASELSIGDKVSTDTILGKVGNSGTKNGSLGTDRDMHAHTDVLVCGELFYEKFNTFDEALDWMVNDWHFVVKSNQ